MESKLFIDLGLEGLNIARFGQEGGREFQPQDIMRISVLVRDFFHLI